MSFFASLAKARAAKVFSDRISAAMLLGPDAFSVELGLSKECLPRLEAKRLPMTTLSSSSFDSALTVKNPNFYD